MQQLTIAGLQLNNNCQAGQQLYNWTQSFSTQALSTMIGNLAYDDDDESVLNSKYGFILVLGILN